jgi:hypothetical protein
MKFGVETNQFQTRAVLLLEPVRLVTLKDVSGVSRFAARVVAFVFRLFESRVIFINRELSQPVSKRSN